eukprot:TRINITY_DN3451_c0_g1_i2.p1 TRINITY_DN3451_c0_g1~~TRINITY_DN3451_c0_g1_i2.p1  ORF type:complete len:116 (-),score=13.34 TRINITY_DN3451_c0_g1_i2:68-415(-)
MLFIQMFVDKLPRCEILDLTNNSIYGKSLDTKNEVDGALIKLLQKLRYVIIHDNPIASIERSDLYWKISRVDDQLLGKLIWIPEKWVKSSSWKRLVNPKDTELIEKTHSEFFLLK